jgi:hypothetical protein
MSTAAANNASGAQTESHARLDVELPPDRGQANNLVPEPERPTAEFASTDWLAELEAALATARKVSDEALYTRETRHMKLNLCHAITFLTAAVQCERSRSANGKLTDTAP